MDPPPTSESEPDDSQPPLAVAAITVAVAQICRSIGYGGACQPALRALSNIAALYLRSLARSAASVANLDGRTDANLLDVARAAEELALGRGFRGASNPRAPVLASEVFKELMRFVRSVEEVPFAQPMPRRDAGGGETRSLSFAQAGREPPMPHVPAWLPCFPEEGRSKGEEEEKEKEKTAAAEEENGGRWGTEEVEERRGLPPAAAAERERVRFKLRADLNNKSMKKRRRTREN